MVENKANVDVVLIMGSTSDSVVMDSAKEVLDSMGIKSCRFIVSAHRTPERLYDFAKSAVDKGFKIIIAGAGGAAHLPGMVASLTNLPVLGVPVNIPPLHGIDSLLSIVQMPKGTPVATFSIGTSGAINAAVFAARILALTNQNVLTALEKWLSEKNDSIPYSLDY